MIGRSSRGGGGGGGRGGSGDYTNPCLTMHQPWASLLVHGIKRIEGRYWPSPIRGRLWIHAAGKVPDQARIKEMDDFYTNIYALNGITGLKFPENYPVSRLLGCVEVVGCVTRDELRCWDEVPEGVRKEGQINFCWLCEQPQICDSAVRGLSPVQGPLPVKFPVRNPQDCFFSKPGSHVAYGDRSGAFEMEKSPRLAAAISGVRAAATQFSQKNYSQPQENDRPLSTRTRSKANEEVQRLVSESAGGSDGKDPPCSSRERKM